MGITTNTLNYIIPAELQLLLYIFRYQIFTISQKLRFSTDFPYQTIQNLVADKNRLSSDEIYWLESFNYERAFRRHQILHSSNNILVLQFAVGRNLIRSSPDFTEEKIDKLKATVPIGRLSKPEDVGNMVAFLCSELGSFICGQSILIDGGRTMWKRS